jgi:hypothetical protein
VDSLSLYVFFRRVLCYGVMARFTMFVACLKVTLIQLVSPQLLVVNFQVVIRNLFLEDWFCKVFITTLEQLLRFRVSAEYQCKFITVSVDISVVKLLFRAKD